MNKDNIKHEWLITGMSFSSDDLKHMKKITDLHYSFYSKYEEEGFDVYWESYISGAISVPFTETGFQDWHTLSREQVVDWVKQLLGETAQEVIKQIAEQTIQSKYNVDASRQEYTFLPWDQ